MESLAKYEHKHYIKTKSTVIPLNYHDLNRHETFKERNSGDVFMEILKTGSITTVFQPIISLKTGIVLGYEALSRGPKSSLLESPTDLFDAARIFGKLWELELLCRNRAIENASLENNGFNFFLNIGPDILIDERFKKTFSRESLKKFNISPENIVMEITENDSINDIESFKKIIDDYKGQGFKIAIDDAGSGYSGLKLITEIHPHFIKLDMNLIRNLDKDGLKHALIKTFYEFCLVTDIKLIAEGIETKDELNALIDIGINYGQGYLIQKPSTQISEMDNKVIDLIKDRNSRNGVLYYSKPSTIFVGDICRNSITVKPSYTGSKVLEIFSTNTSIYCLPVIECNKVMGLIMKDKFFARLGTQYGYALFQNRPINLLVDKHPLTVDYETTIDIVSKLAMTRSSESLYDYIIITRASEYYGIVTVKDLLEKTTQLEVNYAKHLNPLSGLPGNMLIENKLIELISSASPYTVLYLDIDNFKAYNDIYGFENGDKIIQFVGRIIDSISNDCSHNHFLGHIGGDDFIITVESYDVEGICNSVIRLFEKGIKDFYCAEDLERGFVTARNRHGVEEQFGLATISIAGICNKNRVYKDVYELSEQASKIKKKCKEIWSSCYSIE